jgi:hypothetical protein
MFVLVGCRDDELVGRWVWEEDSSFVTTFNDDGTGTHTISWGFGTSFNWGTPDSGRINWDYPDYAIMYTPYSISGDVLTISMDDGTEYRYIRD